MLKTGAHQLGKWLRPLLLSIIVFVPVPSFGTATCPETASDAAIDAIVFRGLASWSTNTTTSDEHPPPKTELIRMVFGDLI